MSSFINEFTVGLLPTYVNEIVLMMDRSGYARRRQSIQEKLCIVYGIKTKRKGSYWNQVDFHKHDE